MLQTLDEGFGQCLPQQPRHYIRFVSPSILQKALKPGSKCNSTVYIWNSVKYRSRHLIRERHEQIGKLLAFFPVDYDVRVLQQKPEPFDQAGNDVVGFRKFAGLLAPGVSCVPVRQERGNGTIEQRVTHAISSGTP